MSNFDAQTTTRQTEWRRANIRGAECGRQNGKEHEWVLPKRRWEEGLWQGIGPASNNPLAAYLADKGIHKHTGVHNLKSSWVLCANLYFPFGGTEQARRLLADFLSIHVDTSIRCVDRIELEYAEEKGPRHPSQLLGEQGGSKGMGQTSPDIAFVVNDNSGLVLTENKFVEHSFYPCSARRLTDSAQRRGNPNVSRCKNAATVQADPSRQCHQHEWGRKYWDHLAPVIRREKLASLRGCPAAKAGYQLFRQQALAEGLAASGAYNLVVSCLAVDARNQTLDKCLKTTGLVGIREWGSLFDGKARFAVFTHQEWVAWVRSHDTLGEWGDWLGYVKSRYGFRA